jgi:hypothetical protein
MSHLSKWMFSLALPVILSSLALAQQPATVDHLQPIRWMAGNTWTADPIDPSSGKKTHIDSVVSKSPNGNNVDFTVSFDGKPQYNGFYTWDPATKQIRFWYTSSEGELSQGTVESDGDALLQTFTITGVDGKVTPLRSHVKPVSADGYDWNVETEKNGKWVELIHLHYSRKA